MIDPAGRIVVAGTTTASGATLARLTASGALDPTFGGGLVTPAAGTDARALLREPGGGLVVGGSIVSGSQKDVWLARVDDAGVLDPTFGTGGTVTTALSSRNEVVGDLVRQPDGKLVAAGGSYQLSPFEVGTYFLVRYAADGTVDGGFGTGGVVMPPTMSGQRTVTALAVAPDGGILAGGTSSSAPDESGGFSTSLMVKRFLADGSSDPAFSVPFEIESDPFLLDLALQSDGRIVTAGVLLPYDGMSPPTSMQVELRRYLPGSYCGNGVVEPGEECDAPGACCQSCTIAPTGTPCDDGNVCTSSDHCEAGTCTGATMAPDRLCAECDPALGVVVRPRAGCKQTTAPHAASLKLRRGSTPANDRLAWKWRKGEAATLADLGDPFTGTSSNAAHELCVFDESGPEPVLLVATEAEPETGPLCARPPCWRTRGASVVYKSSPANPFGLTNMSLTSGAIGRTKTSAKARGEALFTPTVDYAPQPPPWLVPMRVQLGARDGACFEGTFSAAGVRANGTATFSAKSD